MHGCNSAANSISPLPSDQRLTDPGNIDLFLAPGLTEPTSVVISFRIMFRCGRHAEYEPMRRVRLTQPFGSLSLIHATIPSCFSVNSNGIRAPCSHAPSSLWKPNVPPLISILLPCQPLPQSPISEVRLPRVYIVAHGKLALSGKPICFCHGSARYLQAGQKRRA